MSNMADKLDAEPNVNPFYAKYLGYHITILHTRHKLLPPNPP